MRDKVPGICCLATSPGWVDAQLTKNCGIVPLLFHKMYGFRAIMAGGNSGPYPSHDRYLPEVEMDFIADPDGPDVVRYIEERASDIDVLVLHGPQEYYYAAPLERYRALRPDGRVYLELDANGVWMERLPWNTPSFRRFLAHCDVVGASCRRIQRYLAAKWPCRVEYIPNGFYNFDGIDLAVDFAAKENRIVTVGRIGSPEKRHELLLSAFAAVADAFPSWTLRFVGNVEPAFEELVRTFLTKRPDLEKRVVFTGLIRDKECLFEEYRQAKVFALTSFKEGMPNVVAEALFGGCYMVSSDVDASLDMVDGGACGEIFPIDDEAALTSLLVRLLGDEARIWQGGERAMAYGRETFDFTRIIRRLHYLLWEGGDRA